jgi:hypothetical protein
MSACELPASNEMDGSGPNQGVGVQCVHGGGCGVSCVQLRNVSPAGEHVAGPIGRSASNESHQSATAGPYGETRMAASQAGHPAIYNILHPHVKSVKYYTTNTPPKHRDSLQEAITAVKPWHSRCP